MSCPDSTNPDEAPCYLTDKICTPEINFTDQNGASCECPLSGLRSDSPGCLIDPVSLCYPGSVFTRDDVYLCTFPESGLPDQAICYFDDNTWSSGSNFIDEGGATCECPSSGLKSESTSCFIDLDLTCDPGSLFAGDGGNTCIFPESRLQDDANCYIDNDTCTSGTTFLNDEGFSTCTCPCSGLKSQAECTAPSCGAPYIEEKVVSCEPGTSFPSSDGCNTCFCPDNGSKKDAGCTIMLCAIP